MLDDRSPAGALAGVQVACIGPITARAAEAEGLRVDVVASEHTIPGLVQAIVQHLEHSETKKERTL
jgi:uroporphyrinogen-III synthase